MKLTISNQNLLKVILKQNPNMTNAEFAQLLKDL